MAFASGKTTSYFVCLVFAISCAPFMRIWKQSVITINLESAATVGGVSLPALNLVQCVDFIIQAFQWQILDRERILHLEEF